jgi:hypothetical protein
MRKERVEFSILQHKAAIRGSSVALTARTRNRISKGLVLSQKDISSDVDVIVYALDQSLPYGSFDRVHSDRIETATKSFSSRAQIAHKSLANADSMIVWADRIGNIDIKALGSIGRGAQAYDPDAQDADGDGLVQDNTPWERPSITQRAKRKIKKGKRRLANILEQGADKLDERQSRREQRGPLKERIAGRLDDVASRVEARKLKPKKPKKTRVMDYLGLSPTDKPSEVPEKPRKPKAPEADAPEADIPEAVTPTPKTPEVEAEEPDAWAEAIDNWKKKPSGSAAAEDITATAVSEEKLPGKAFGTAHKDQNSALLGAKDASSKKKDVVFHVVKDEDGKMIVVDDERMKAMKAKPIASYKDGSMIMRNGAPVKKKKQKVTQKEIDDAPGWSGGGKFGNAETAIGQASSSTYTYPDKTFEEGDSIHVVMGDGGFAVLVDDEKLQALGVEPVASFNHNGEEIAWGMTDPVKKPKKESKPKPVGEIPGEPAMPTLDETLPKTEVVNDAKKKTPKLGGKQFGRPFKNEKSAAKRADELGVDGNKYHVVETDQGFRVVDQDRLDAMGIKPVHTSGEKYFKPSPAFKPKEDAIPEADKEAISFDKKKELDNAILTVGGTDINNDAEAAKALAELDKINIELDGFTSNSESEALKNDLENVRNDILKKYPDAGKNKTPDGSSYDTDGLKKEFETVASSGDFDKLNKFDKKISALLEKRDNELDAAGVDEVDKYNDPTYKALAVLEDNIMGLREAIGANAQEGIKPKKQPKPKKITTGQSGQIQFAMAILKEDLTKPSSEWTNGDKDSFEMSIAELEDILDSYEQNKVVDILREELAKIDSSYSSLTKKVPTKKELDDALEAKLSTLADAESLNASMAGVYSDKELTEYKKVFEKALAELESLTPEERKAFGAYNDYEDELVGIRNNIAIIGLTIGTGKDIQDVVDEFFKAELDKSKVKKKKLSVKEHDALSKELDDIIYEQYSNPSSDKSSTEIQNLVNAWYEKLDSFETDESLKPKQSGSAQSAYIVSVESLKNMADSYGLKKVESKVEKKKLSLKEHDSLKDELDAMLQGLYGPSWDGKSKPKPDQKLVDAWYEKLDGFETDGSVEPIPSGSTQPPYIVSVETLKEMAETYGMKRSESKDPVKKEFTPAMEAKLGDWLLQAEIINDSTSGVYSDEELTGYKKVFETALSKLESLTPEEREIFGDYEEELAGLERNIAIFGMAVGTGKDINDVVTEFFKTYKPKPKADAGDVLESTGLPKRLSKDMSPLEKEASNKFRDSVGADYEAYTKPDGTFDSKKWNADRKKSETDYQDAVKAYDASPTQENLDKYLDAYARSLFLSSETANAKSYFEKKKSVKKNKPLGKDETPAWSTYGGTSFMEPEGFYLDPWLNGKGKELAEANGTSLREEAKTHFKGVELQIKEIADDLKPGGKYEGLDQNALLDALSGRSIDADSPAEKEASDILIGLIEREAFAGVPTSKDFKNAAKTYGLAAKKKIKDMGTEEKETPTGSALSGYKNTVQGILDSDKDTIDKMNDLWDLKYEIDKYSSDLKVDGESDKAAEMDTASNDVYKEIEQLSLNLDTEKAMEIAPKLDMETNNVANLIDNFQDTDVANWTESQKADWLNQHATIKYELESLGKDGPLGDLVTEQLDYLDAALQDFENAFDTSGFKGSWYLDSEKKIYNVVNGENIFNEISDSTLSDEQKLQALDELGKQLTGYISDLKVDGETGRANEIQALMLDVDYTKEKLAEEIGYKISGEDLFSPQNLPKSVSAKETASMSQAERDIHYESVIGELDAKLDKAKKAFDYEAVKNIINEKGDLLKKKLLEDFDYAQNNPKKVSPDSPVPFKTSKQIDASDKDNATELVISTELSAAKDNLIDYLGKSGIADTSLLYLEETNLPDGETGEQWVVKSVAGERALRKSLVEKLRSKVENGDDIGEIAALRTHLHNFDVLTRDGSYSSENAPDMTAIDRFNHLGPSAQKGIIKSLSNSEADFKKAALAKIGTKKQTKKQVAEDIKKIEESVNPPEPEAPKIQNTSASAVSAQIEEVKASGGKINQAFIDAAPEGAILGVVSDWEKASQQVNDGNPPKFKGKTGVLHYFESDDSKVGYWVDEKFTKNDELGAWQDTVPHLYSYDGKDPDGNPIPAGVISGSIATQWVKGDFTPSEGSPIFEKSSLSTSDEYSLINDIVNPFEHAFMDSGSKNFDNINLYSTDAGKTFDKGFYEKFGSNGGVVVKDSDGLFHVVKRSEWKALTGEQQDQFAVIRDIKPVWSTWAGSEVGTGKLPNDFNDLTESEKLDVVTAWMNQPAMTMDGFPNAYALQNSGLISSTSDLLGLDNEVSRQNISHYVDQVQVEINNGNGPDEEMAFYSVKFGDADPVILRIKGSNILLADQYPGIFQKIGGFDSSGSYTDYVGEMTPDSSKMIGKVLSNPDDNDWMEAEGIDTAATFAVANNWAEKLDGGGATLANKKLEEANVRLADMKKQFDMVFDGKDISKMSEDEIKAAFTEKGLDHDSFITKMRSTLIRRQAAKAWLANNSSYSLDSMETVAEVNKNLLTGAYNDPKDLIPAINDAGEQANIAKKMMEEAAEALNSGVLGDKTTAEHISDYISAKQKMKASIETERQIKEIATQFKDKKYAGKTVLIVDGEERFLKQGSVFHENSPSVQQAADVATAIAPILKQGQQLGIFKTSDDKYAVIDMDEAINANMSAPEAIFTNAVPGSMPVADATDVMDLMTSPGMPKVKEGYAGIENLGVSAPNGVAIGKFVPSGLPADASDELITKEAKVWGAHIASGGSLAEVPNDLLLEVVWQHREGGDGSERFKFLSKASGYNDTYAPDEKKKTHRFLDTATGHTFVIKSATRNDQEGARELFGNQVMQTLGFPSSGGRTASVIFTAPNKYAQYSHPDSNPESEQFSVLLESSEMLYEGKNLGHVRDMPKSQRDDAISRLTPESVANGVVMDSMFRYYDRQGHNWIAVENPDGTVQYHPIDHGNAFGDFKQHKFFDKDGNKMPKGANSQATEDKLGFMFSGLDGEGTWKLAKDSMNTPERRQRFAEAVLHAVHRAETTDYVEEAEKLISGQNLSGANAATVRKSAERLNEKKARIASYVEPMLKELGMSDEEIATARQTVENEVGTGLLKASKTPKKVTSPGQASSAMTKAEPIAGEEAFGNTPTLPNAKTVTSALEAAQANVGSHHYVSVGSGQVKGGARIHATPLPGGGNLTTMTLAIDDNEAKALAASLSAKIDASGAGVEILSVGGQHMFFRTDNGVLKADPRTADAPTPNGYNANFTEIGGTSGENASAHVIAKTEEGHVIIVNTGTAGSAYSTAGTVQVHFAGDTAPTPEEIHKLLGRVGIKDAGYTSDDQWKAQAAELLVRTYDGFNPTKMKEPLGTRLARVASEQGVTVNDLEPYFDSMGRMRFRLTDEAWARVQAKNPGLKESGHVMIKTMNTYADEANITRMITSGGVLSKADQVTAGFGLGGTSVGGGGGGASAQEDLGTGGGKGVFMTPVSTTGKHAGVWPTRGTDVIFDGEAMLRDIGWWAHGPNDGPFGVINPDNSRIGTVSSKTSVGNMVKKETFEFLPDGAATLDKMKGIVLNGGYSANRRMNLIKMYRDQGIEEINGIPLEDFFIASPDGARKMLGPDFSSTSLHGFSVASKSSLNKPAQESVVLPGDIPTNLNSLYFHVGDKGLKKTPNVGTAKKRALKAASENTDVKFHVVRDAAGNYRVLSNLGLEQLIGKNAGVTVYATYLNGKEAEKYVPGTTVV